MEDRRTALAAAFVVAAVAAASSVIAGRAWWRTVHDDDDCERNTPCGPFWSDRVSLALMLTLLVNIATLVAVPLLASRRARRVAAGVSAVEQPS